MKKVLTRTLISTIISSLLLFVFYLFTNGKWNKEIVFAIWVLALVAAIPITFGYIISYSSARSPNSILIGLKFLLFIFNGFLIIGTSTLTISILTDTSIVIIAIPFILSGVYTYIETAKIVTDSAISDSTPSIDNDILDDGFM